jgi:hypothetical protein
MHSKQWRAILIVVTTIVPVACAPLLAPSPPTLDPNALNTVIAGTAAAAATETALLTPPTWTSIPTIFPSATIAPSATITETFIFQIFSPTATVTMTATQEPTQNYACSVVAQSPQNGTNVARRATFETRWTLVNTGFQPWDSSDTDFIFSNGEKLHEQSAYDLNVTIQPGETVTLVVDMRAPNQKGDYTTVWQVRSKNVRFCSMRLSIDVV